MTDSLEYSMSILRHQLTETTHSITIMLGHCDETKISKKLKLFDMQSAVMIICYYNGKINFWFFMSYVDNNCKHKISKIQTEVVNESFISNIKSFYRLKEKIVRNCPINVAATERAPFVYFQSFENLTGIDIKILNEIASSLNLKLQILTSNFTSNAFDIFVGYYPFQIKEEFKLKTSQPFDFCEFIYVVPLGNRISSLEKLFQAFDKKIWILICLMSCKFDLNFNIWYENQIRENIL